MALGSVAGWGVGWWLVVNALAVYRLARLVARDTILQGFRKWLSNRYEGMLVELVHCTWCSAFWIACVVEGLTLWIPSWWATPATVLAISALAGLLSELA